MLNKLTGKRWQIDLAKVIIGVGIVAWLGSADLGHYADELTAVGDVAAAESRGMTEDALLIKCRMLQSERRWDEAYDVARIGYNKFRTNEWRFRYGMECAFRYQYNSDYSALKRAEKLFRAYTTESPYDPEGHVQLGWSLSHLGRRDEARREFYRALAIDPNDQRAKDKLKYVQP